MLRDRLDVGERWACRVVGQHRSTQRYEHTMGQDDAVLRARLRQVSADRPRWGTELIAHALMDWCRFTATSTSYIDPGSRWQNAFVESFNGRVRDQLLSVEEFSCLAEARVVISDWHEDYNTRRPHSALRMRAPAAFAAAWTAGPPAGA